MHQVMIVGAGRVGLAAAKIIRYVTGWDISLVDTSLDALNQCDKVLRFSVPTSSTAGAIFIHHAPDNDTLAEVVRSVKPDVVMCTTPFNVNTVVARIACEVGCHYVDFTEDVRTTAEIASLPITTSTFVPQTGLAPGLVSYVGLDLFDRLDEPHSLDLRVGALPQVAFGPAHYAITWSPEGLVNEYIKPAFKKYDGEVWEVEPLTGYEQLLVDGVIYEGFTTSGGVGDLDAYPHIPFVKYKTLRHPGHLDFIKSNILQGPEFTLDIGVERAKKIFHRTRDDVVVMAAYAVDKSGNSASFGAHFAPDKPLGLTALELTTAGTGVAVVELILGGYLKTGVLKPSDITIQSLRKNSRAIHLVFGAARQ